MQKCAEIQIVGYSDAAGRIRPSDPLSGNQDNFFINMPESPQSQSLDQGDPMPQSGVVMAVADGAGGLKHGEVASQVAIDTVAECFRPERLMGVNLQSLPRRRAYLADVIRRADVRIKQKTSYDVNGKVMGSTLVVAWLYGDELVVSWIGDSRAYLYNRQNGIVPLSRDHSKVQMMIDSGEITAEEAFSHRDRNKVTRILGDPTQEAQPDSVSHKVKPGDVILLCSDGLSGVLRDRPGVDRYGNPYHEEDIETIIRQAQSVHECTHSLWSAARRNHWHDNCTTILCRIVSVSDAQPERISLSKPMHFAIAQEPAQTDTDRIKMQAPGPEIHLPPHNPIQQQPRKSSPMWLALPVVLLVLLVVFLVALLMPAGKSEKTAPTPPPSTTIVETIDDNVPLADITEEDDSDNQ